MKQVLFAALALLLGLSSAWAQSRTITMSGQGEEQAVPDVVTLSAGVSTQAPTAAAALSANSGRMQTVFAALKKLGVADKDMQTDNFSVQPQMTDNRVTSYQVSNQVRVRLEDVSKLGGALDALVSAGANQMYGVNYSFKDSAPLLAKARADAVDDAKAKADIYAKAAGVSLGPILSISENENSGPRPVFMAPMMAKMAATPVAAGEESVSATVSIVWEIH